MNQAYQRIMDVTAVSRGRSQVRISRERARATMPPPPTPAATGPATSFSRCSRIVWGGLMPASLMPSIIHTTSRLNGVYRRRRAEEVKLGGKLCH
jgi:hypothetical protein